MWSPARSKMPGGSRGPADAGDVDVALGARKDVLERLRVADCQPHVLAFDAAAEKLARGLVGEADDAAVEHHRRLVERFEERWDAGGGHS